MAHIFISYSKKDIKFARELQALLLAVFGATIIASCGAATTPMSIPLGYPGNSVTSNAQWTHSDIQQYSRTFDGIEMVLVPAGCFRMGDPSDPQIGDGGEQCFDTPFYISRYEVTNAEFNHFGCTAQSPSYWTDDNRPRETVTWFEARDCAAKIDQQLGGGWKLPTEAEWEYAARGPDDRDFPWGYNWNSDNVVWSGNSNNQTAPVGSKGTNGESWVGANDLAGNVWEWVSSLYKDYPNSARDGREDLTNRTGGRVARGGAFDYDLVYIRSDYRFNLFPDVWNFSIGFRLVKVASVEDS